MTGRLLKSAGRLIRLRYLLLTTAVGGGITIQNVRTIFYNNRDIIYIYMPLNNYWIHLDLIPEV